MAYLHIMQHQRLLQHQCQLLIGKAFRQIVMGFATEHAAVFFQGDRLRDALLLLQGHTTRFYLMQF